MIKLKCFLALVLGLSPLFGHGQEKNTELQISRLTLQGDRWTCEVGGRTMSGILIRPPGEGPFPGMLISHGMGSNAEQFGRAKAREFVKWGFVCIATDYTHARTVAGNDRSQYGASAENIRRAKVCLEILRRQLDVDVKRLVAYGNSMGAFVTIGLVADYPEELAAAIVTAGGIVPVSGQAAPSSERAAHIITPMLMLHGGLDTTVPPERSAFLKKVLDEKKTPNERVLFEESDHGLHQSKASECFTRMHDWLLQQSLIKL